MDLITLPCLECCPIRIWDFIPMPVAFFTGLWNPISLFLLSFENAVNRARKVVVPKLPGDSTLIHHHFASNKIELFRIRNISYR